MHIQVSRWGNSLGLRIPKAYASLLNLNAGDVVEVIPSQAGLTIQKPRKRYELAELLAGVTPENRHAEVSWGKPEGQEIW